MSQTTIALEGLVAEVIANRAAEGEQQTARQRAATNRAFAALLHLLKPRIRHFIRQYGLIAYWEDAEQVAAIAVHRAIEAYDPEKAQFTTFVNWQIRGEMQGLRFRLMTDQRSSAVKVNATTVSLQSLSCDANGETTDFIDTIKDEEALERVESGASDYLTKRAMEKLTNEYIRSQRELAIKQLQRGNRKSKAVPAANRDLARLKINTIDPVELEKLDKQLACKRSVIEERMFELATPAHHDATEEMTRERMRQVSRHAARAMTDIVANNEDFRIMREYRQASGMGICAAVTSGPVSAAVPVVRVEPMAAVSTRPPAKVFDLTIDRPLAELPVSISNLVARAAFVPGQTMVTTLLAA